MREQIVKGRKFNILSRSIDNASGCQVVDVTEEDFTVKLELKGKYEIDETVELFAMTEKGQLYFETIVKKADDDLVSMWFPINYKYLQRREYSRIMVDHEVELIFGEKKFKAKLVDLSAGGLKLVTLEQLELLKDYSLVFEIENKKVETFFEPIRIEAFNQYYISSGRFKDLSNYDRIALVQYCFMKQIENSNK